MRRRRRRLRPPSPPSPRRCPAAAPSPRRSRAAEAQRWTLRKRLQRISVQTSALRTDRLSCFFHRTSSGSLQKISSVPVVAQRASLLRGAPAAFGGFAAFASQLRALDPRQREHLHASTASTRLSAGWRRTRQRKRGSEARNAEVRRRRFVKTFSERVGLRRLRRRAYAGFESRK
eukprot:scaffold878_cov271-Pinguiococcus_pyrenoidosus.AAC.47